IDVLRDGAVARAVFFYSSRRRHTRLVSDWSSDVCSSDLIFLRALGMKSNEDILRTFYQVERITLRDGNMHWNVSEGLMDRKLSRSEERRVGKEWRSRWSADHLKRDTKERD